MPSWLEPSGLSLDACPLSDCSTSAWSSQFLRTCWFSIRKSVIRPGVRICSIVSTATDVIAAVMRAVRIEFGRLLTAPFNMYQGIKNAASTVFFMASSWLVAACASPSERVSTGKGRRSRAGHVPHKRSGGIQNRLRKFLAGEETPAHDRPGQMSVVEVTTTFPHRKRRPYCRRRHIWIRNLQQSHSADLGLYDH